MKPYLLFCIIIFSIVSCNQKQENSIQIKGELKQWHKITLEIPGPQTSEWDKQNPFLDYKLDVTFTNGTETYIVPGFYDADGNAAETSADEGNSWKIRFCPDKTGTWSYKISFKKGKDIAVKGGDGESVSSDGVEGSFDVAESDKTGDDFRAKGRIVNGGKGYFKFQNSTELWIKNGADSPENFLAYADFDQTYRYSNQPRSGEADPKKDLHKYETHISDWNEGDPTWQGTKGKGIIGALNYLHSVGINSVYMLTMNIMGDGKDVWPYTDHNERYRFDCSKLDQWEIVFDHMDHLGMMMHFVLQETENECLLDEGYTDVQRKLYLRELIARFGHHLAVTWNIGEENGPASWTPIGQTDQQRKDMANYFKNTNPYPNIMVLHTHADDEHQDEYLTPMLGFKNLDGPSMQIGNVYQVHQRILKFVDESKNAGKQWLVNLDEIGPASKGVMPDAFDANHDTIRSQCLWGTLMAGGAGVEWYCGYQYPDNDLNLETFKTRENWWKQSTLATQFMLQFPLEEMVSSDDLVNVKDAYCLAKEGEVYLVYIPAKSKNIQLKLRGTKSFEVNWFNAKEGGALQKGSVASVQGEGFQKLGTPPSNPDQDWLVVLK